MSAERETLRDSLRQMTDRIIADAQETLDRAEFAEVADFIRRRVPDRFHVHVNSNDQRIVVTRRER